MITYIYPIYMSPHVSEVEQVRKTSAARYSGGSLSFLTFPVKVTGSLYLSAKAARLWRAGPSPAITSRSARLPSRESMGRDPAVTAFPLPARSALSISAPSRSWSSASSACSVSFSGARRCTINIWLETGRGGLV